MQKTFIEQLEGIFEQNKDKRILVIGTTCTGKSYLINQLGYGVDMDKAIFPLLTPEETDYVCQTPWTEEIGAKMDQLVRERIKVEAGQPLYGTVLLESDLIVYLHINDELLKKRTDLRKVDFANAKNMQNKIEDELKNTDKPVIKLEVSE